MARAQAKESSEVSWCTHDACDRIDLHPAHDEDFARRRGRPITGRVRERAPRVRSDTKAARLAKIAAPPVVRGHVRCPECDGGGCGLCLETGMIPMHLWRQWRVTSQ